METVRSKIATLFPTLVIPSGLTRVGNSVFYNCRTFGTIVFPSEVTNIGSNTFNACYGAAVYDFTLHTAVPSLSNANAFAGIASDCVIKVPAALADEWKAATNWSTYASYIVGV